MAMTHRGEAENNERNQRHGESNKRKAACENNNGIKRNKQRNNGNGNVTI